MIKIKFSVAAVCERKNSIARLLADKIGPHS